MESMKQSFPRKVGCAWRHHKQNTTGIFLLKEKPISTGVKIHPVSMSLGTLRWEIYSSSALCSYLLSCTVMVKTPCLWEKDIYQYLNWSGFGFVLGFLQAPVLIWTCLRVSQRQKTQLIVAFLCKTPPNQHLFLIRSLQSHPLTAPFASRPGPRRRITGTKPHCSSSAPPPLSPAMEPVREGLSGSDISLPPAAAAFLKAFSSRRKSLLFCGLLWSRGPQLESGRPFRWFVQE